MFWVIKAWIQLISMFDSSPTITSLERKRKKRQKRKRRQKRKKRLHHQKLVGFHVWLEKSGYCSNTVARCLSWKTHMHLPQKGIVTLCCLECTRFFGVGFIVQLWVLLIKSLFQGPTVSGWRGGGGGSCTCRREEGSWEPGDTWLMDDLDVALSRKLGHTKKRC